MVINNVKGAVTMVMCVREDTGSILSRTCACMCYMYMKSPYLKTTRKELPF